MQRLPKGGEKIKQRTEKRFVINRVDVQVSVFTASVVVISCLILFWFHYSLTYHDMLLSLADRIDALYSFLENELEADTFTQINSREDMSEPSYLRMKLVLERVKNSTGVAYLYTAKRDARGNLIYVVDGLQETAPDFRYPGDLIEPEITAELSRALQGELVLPGDIKQTDWGEIFVAYMPVHGKDGAVLGAVGIEFSATHQFMTYRKLRRLTPVIMLFSCVASAAFALLFFRRISNPLFQDLANTDYLTGIKNRNAYELDVKNMCAREQAAHTGLILADLNGLKLVNDTLGHDAGDEYIQALADALRAARENAEVLYRVGGDEFVVLMENARQEELAAFIARAEKAFINPFGEKVEHASCSYGWAICEGNQVESFEKTYREADKNMYDYKKSYYMRFNQETGKEEEER